MAQQAAPVQQPLDSPTLQDAHLPSNPSHPHDDQALPLVQDPPAPKVTRLTPPEKQDPSVRFKDASTKAAEKGEWGTGQDGYKPPTEPGDRMRYLVQSIHKPFILTSCILLPRKNLPYKVLYSATAYKHRLLTI